MKKIAFLISFIFVSMNVFAQSAVFRWAKHLEGDAGKLTTTSVVHDNSGNVLTTGSFNGRVDFDPGPATFYLNSATVANDIFVTKTDASGSFIWAIRIGANDAEDGKSITTDGAGNVYVYGNYRGIVAVDFDPGTGIFNLPAASGISTFILKLDSSGNFIWAKAFGGTTVNVYGNSIKLDVTGNVYTAGTFYGNVDFDPGIGTFTLSAFGNGDCYITKLDASGNFVWAKSFGTTNTEDMLSTSIDGAGNLLTTGLFSGTTDFDPGAGTYNLTSSGSQDIFICKFDGSGNLIWAKKVGGTAADAGLSIAVDATNNVYTTGYFAGTVDFDPDTSVFNLSAGAFILKLDPSGNFNWAKAFSGSNIGYSICVDGLNNILTTGRFASTIDFDPGVGIFNLTSSGSNDIFVSKLDNSGNFVWADGMGGSLSDEGKSIAVDASNNIAIAGNILSGVADMDPGPGIFNVLNSNSNPGRFVSKLNASGVFLWAQSAGYAASAIINDICLDASGNIISIGIFTGIFDFDVGAGTFYLASTQRSPDVFITKYDSSGNFIWAKKFDGPGADYGNSIEVDGSGNIISTGSFAVTVDFDPGAPVANLTAVGGFDIFISKLSSSGNFMWAKKVGGTLTDYASSLSIDPSGNVLTTGYYYNTVDFDPGTGIFNLVGTAGAPCTFILKLNSSGNFIWAKKFSSQYTNKGFAIETDLSGNVITTGIYSSSGDFDPGTGTYNLTSIAYEDIFVSKLDASGNFLWAKSFGGGNYDDVTSLASDASGNIFILGFFTDSLDFDPGPGIFNMTSFAYEDIYVSKLDPSGNFLWAKKAPSGGTDNGYAITTDNAGNCYFTGCNGNSLRNVVINKMDAAGNLAWAKIIGGFEEDIGYAIAVDPNLNVYTAGKFYGVPDFDPDPGIYTLTSLGQPAAFIQKMAQCILSPASITPAGTAAFCTGGNIVLNANTGSGLTYQWQNNLINITGATNPSYTVTTAGYYRVVVTNSCGPAYSSEVTITINPLPGTQISASGPTTFCSGGSVTLNSYIGTGLTYQWRNNGVDIPGQTAISYTTNTSGSYTVVVTNANNCTRSSNPVVVTVNPIPVATITPAGPTSLCTAGSVVLNATTGTGFTYQWKNNGVNISGQTTSSYTATAAGNYTVVVSNSCGSITSSVVAVTITPLPIASITPAGPTTFCSGGSVLLNANTGTGLTYQWKNNGVSISGQTNASYSAGTSGSYTVVVTNSNNCSNTSPSVAVTVSTTVTTNITESICPGQSYTLPDGQIVNTTGIYQTLIPNGSGCDSLVIVNLTVNDLVAPLVANCPANFTTCSPVSWIPPQFSDNCLFTVTSNYVPGTFFVPGVHTITYTATDAGNNTTSCSFDVTVLPAPVLPDSLGSDKPFNNICVNQNITLTVYGGFQGTWEWFTGSCGSTLLPAYSGMSSITVSPLVTTTYFVRSVNSCNITSCLSLTVIVNNNPPGTLSVVSMPSMGYIGGSGTIVCNVDPDAVFYRWKLLNGPQNAALFNGSIGPVETTTNSVNVDFLLAQNKYNIRILSGNACGRSNNENISIRGTVEPAACLNGPVIVCPSQNATYSVLTCPIPNATSYQWTIQPPSAATITSGQGSAAINVHFAAGYTSAEICVAGLSQSSIIGPETCVTVAPSSSVAGAITGDMSPCMSTTGNYNVMPVSGATGYLWTTTIPGAVVSGTTTTGTVQFPAGPFTGNLCVQSLTACGPSLPSCTSITSVTPGVPGTITGPVSNLCGASNINYSLGTNNANSYTWILPSGITLLSGGGSNSINVNFNAGTVGPQTISVQATYDCNVASSSIIVDGTPGIPGVSPATICPGTEQFFTASSGGPGITYAWTITGDVTSYCTNPGCSQFYVDWLPSGCTLSVTANNSCGTSATFVVPNNCRMADAELPGIRIYPNPTDGEFTLEFESSKEEIRNILITDQTGRIVLQKDISSTKGMMQHLLDLGNVEPGIYNLTLTDDDGNFWMERITLIK